MEKYKKSPMENWVLEYTEKSTGKEITHLLWVEHGSQTIGLDITNVKNNRTLKTNISITKEEALSLAEYLKYHAERLKK